MTAEAGGVYERVRFTQTVALLSQDLVFFLDRAVAYTEHTYEVVYHQRGHWTDVPPGDPAPDSNAPGQRASVTSRRAT